jgi:hypothetical protein
MELEKEFGIPDAIKIVKTSRLRFPGHMIKKPEDLPHKKLNLLQNHNERSAEEA